MSDLMLENQKYHNQSAERLRNEVGDVSFCEKMHTSFPQVLHRTNCNPTGFLCKHSQSFKGFFI